MMRTERQPRWLQLGVDERFFQSSAANRSTGRIAAGGWLALTSDRLIHHTHLLERRITGTQDWQADLTDITEVGIADRGGFRRLFTGGLRHQLRITTADGTETLFVVDAIMRWQEAVQRAVNY